MSAPMRHHAAVPLQSQPPVQTAAQSTSPPAQTAEAQLTSPPLQKPANQTAEAGAVPTPLPKSSNADEDKSVLLQPNKPKRFSFFDTLEDKKACYPKCSDEYLLFDTLEDISTPPQVRKSNGYHSRRKPYQRGPKQQSKSPPSPPTTIPEAEKDAEDTRKARNSPKARAASRQAQKKAMEDSWEAVNRPDSSLKPKSKKATKAAWAAWNGPASLLTSSAGIANPRWPRGPVPRPKKHVWPKAKDMKPLASKDGSDYGIMVDNDYDDVKNLQGWDGNWMPPPVEWDNRAHYVNNHLAKDMDKWIPDDKKLQCPVKIEEPAFSGRQTVGGPEALYVPGETIPGADEYNEIVPREWLEPRVGDKTLLEYWKDVPRAAPSALSDIDVMADPPWWDRYKDKISCYLINLEAPESKVNQRDEGDLVTMHQMASAETKIKSIAIQRQVRHDWIIEKRSRSVHLAQETISPPVEDRRIQPTINFHIRPIQIADIGGISEIYNWYINKTIFAKDFKPLPDQAFRNRINRSITAGIPIMVAVSRSSKATGRAGYKTEKIVGYVGLDDNGGHGSMFRFTFTMDLYVHHEFVNKGIGKCLVDKLLEFANTSYIPRGGYQYENNFDYLKVGHQRAIKTILFHIHHETEEVPEYQVKFLTRFGFAQSGHVPGMGYKQGKVIDVSTFFYQTGETIDPNSVPCFPAA